MLEWYDWIYDESAGPGADLEEWMVIMLEESRQPEVVDAVLDIIVNAAESFGGRVRDENHFEFILAVCAVVREASYWPWKR
jgi:hypothetical protein